MNVIEYNEFIVEHDEPSEEEMELYEQRRREKLQEEQEY